MPNMHHKGQAYLKLHPQIKQQLNAFTYLLLGNYIAKKKTKLSKRNEKNIKKTKQYASLTKSRFRLKFNDFSIALENNI